jgi:type IV pilus assembly protein PilM
MGGFQSFLSGGEFFSLDIGTTAVRVVQLRGSGVTKSLSRYGSVPIDMKTAQSDSAADKKKLSDTIAQTVKQTGVTTKDVVVGVPSHKMFVTVVDFPKLAHNELDKTIRYQLETHIPTPLNETKVDWAILGDSPVSSDSVEVLIAAVPNSYAEARLDLLETTGLNVLAIEPDGFALARALLPAGAKGAYLILDVGDSNADLIISYDGNPRLIRSVPIGASTFVKAAQQNLSIDEKQAEQFVYKFGMNPDKLEGQVAKALENSANNLIGEIQKSTKFFSGRYSGVGIEKIIVTGGASTLPGFPLFIANTLGTQVEIGNAWLNVSYPQSKHNDLLALSNHFAVATGLAERTSL